MRYRSWLAALFALAFGLSLGAAALADVPAGAVINATLQQTLDTKTSKVGDSVLMTIASITPESAFDPSLKGATIRGHVSQVVGATPTKKAYIGIAFDTLTLADGRTYPFPATITALKKKKSVNIPQAAGEVLAGMIVGNILGKSVGTGAGGAVGAAGGAVYAASMATNFKIPQNSTVQMKTTNAIVLGAPHPQST
jgi:hypothetical protein